MVFDRKEYHKNWYKKNKEKSLRKDRIRRRRLRPYRQQRKHCNECGKEMKRVDYVVGLAPQVQEAVWVRRKYCCERCLMRHSKKIQKKKYINILILKETKNKIMKLGYGKMTINGTLNQLYESVEKRRYGHEFIGMVPTELPRVVKILCLQETNEYGGKEKGSTFFIKFKTGDKLGEFLRGDKRYRVVNILSSSPTKDEENQELNQGGGIKD